MCHVNENYPPKIHSTNRVKHYVPFTDTCGYHKPGSRVGLTTYKKVLNARVQKMLL